MVRFAGILEKGGVNLNVKELTPEMEKKTFEILKKEFNREFIFRIAEIEHNVYLGTMFTTFDNILWLVGNRDKFLSLIGKAWFSGKEVYRRKYKGNYYIEFVTRP